MTDVLITRVACISHGFDRQQGPSLCTSVELIDAFSREIVLSEDMQDVRYNADPNNKTGGEDGVTSVILQPSILLPRGFVGIIISRYGKEQEGIHNESVMYSCKSLTYFHANEANTHLLQFLKVSLISVKENAEMLWSFNGCFINVNIQKRE